MAVKFKLGDKVRVRGGGPPLGSPPGHFRTPAYIQGKTGRIATVHGEFRNPESLAYGGEGLPKQCLYLVGFDQEHIWQQYEVPLQDKLFIDIYEHWLEPA